MEESKPKAEDKDRDIVFSHSVKAGKRIYYLDVRKTRKDEYYLSITESKKIAGSETADGKASFEKHKIFLYREDFGNFIDGLSRTMRFIHDADAGTGVGDTDSGNEKSDIDFDIEF